LLPAAHPERFVLANEVHARPYEALDTPQRASYVVVLVEPEERAAERAHLVALFESHGVPPPDAGAIHFSATLGPVRLKWERHGEFTTYTVFARGHSPTPFAQPAISLIAPDWVAAIPGRTMAAAHAKLVAAGSDAWDAQALTPYFGNSVVVGAEVADGAGLAFTDFTIQADRYVRFLVVDREFSPRQAGRVMQRLFEIEAYRVMALLGLPLARSEAPEVSQIERQLGELTEAMTRGDSSDDSLLAELSRLAMRVERALAQSQYRFGASRAYYDLVKARIGDLREGRLAGVQTIEEFLVRRLAPAMATIDATGRRMGQLSERIARASNLLSTRVDIARQKQSQALLASMDRRARLQLRLQQTVEGVSAVAITYYAVSLLGYCAQALASAGVNLDPKVVMGVATPVIVLLAALGIRHVRKRLARSEAGERTLT
jgi:uncharacterized membrane-anchored protein